MSVLNFCSIFFRGDVALGVCFGCRVSFRATLHCDVLCGGNSLTRFGGVGFDRMGNYADVQLDSRVIKST